MNLRVDPCQPGGNEQGVNIPPYNIDLAPENRPKPIPGNEKVCKNHPFFFGRGIKLVSGS